MLLKPPVPKLFLSYVTNVLSQIQLAPLYAPGRLCARCTAGWFRLGRDCLKCSGFWNPTLLKFIYVFLLLPVFYMIRKLSTVGGCTSRA
jgi:hypothetical protein